MNRLLLLFLGLSLLAVPGCTSFEAQEVLPAAFVSLYNASPDSPPLDILVRGQKVNDQPFKYADHVVYRQFYTGERLFQFKTVTEGNEVLVKTINFEPQKFYTVYLVNPLSSLDTYVTQDTSKVPASGKAMVRFIHLSPDAPEVNFYYEKDGVNHLLKEGLTFKTGSPFMEVDANITSFFVGVQGEVNEEEENDAEAGEPVQIIVENNGVSFTSGHYYTFVLRGFFENGPTDNATGLNLDYFKN